jgi:predicted transposase YbfD/YdcC
MNQDVAIKLRNELECEKRLRQKMADKVAELEKQLAAEKQKKEEHKFIREHDNQEIIRLEKDIQRFTQTVIVSGNVLITFRDWKRKSLS